MTEARLVLAWADNAIVGMKAIEDPYLWAGQNAEALGQVERVAPAVFVKIQKAIKDRCAELGIYPVPEGVIHG